MQHAVAMIVGFYELFSIRVKELFEPTVMTVLQRQVNGFLVYLKLFSWEPESWVTLGNFCAKKRQNCKGKLYSTENRLSRN